MITPKLATVSNEIKEPCKSPSDIPAGGEVAIARAYEQWGVDRDALEECGVKHKALVDSINVLEGKTK